MLYPCRYTYYDINMINVHRHQNAYLPIYLYIMVVRVVYEYYVRVVKLRLFARTTRHDDVLLNGPFCKIDTIILYR